MPPWQLGDIDDPTYVSAPVLSRKLAAWLLSITPQNVMNAIDLCAIRAEITGAVSVTRGFRCRMENLTTSSCVNIGQSLEAQRIIVFELSHQGERFVVKGEPEKESSLLATLRNWQNRRRSEGLTRLELHRPGYR